MSQTSNDSLFASMINSPMVPQISTIIYPVPLRPSDFALILPYSLTPYLTPSNSSPISALHPIPSFISTFYYSPWANTDSIARYISPNHLYTPSSYHFDFKLSIRFYPMHSSRISPFEL